MDPFSPNMWEEAMMVGSRQAKKRSGRKKFRETRHPVYRGVRQRDSGKWVCEVREPQKQMRIWLGTFPTAKMAARAHDMATLTLRGRLACLNFADSAWKLTVSASKDTKDIQRAASKAARDFGEDEETETPPFLYMDEEEVLGMPRLLANMAQGMLLPPPTYDLSPELNTDLSLWT